MTKMNKNSKYYTINFLLITHAENIERVPGKVTRINLKTDGFLAFVFHHHIKFSQHLMLCNAKTNNQS